MKQCIYVICMLRRCSSVKLLECFVTPMRPLYISNVLFNITKYVGSRN